MTGNMINILINTLSVKYCCEEWLQSNSRKTYNCLLPVSDSTSRRGLVCYLER